jgi:hypothetical protein
MRRAATETRRAAALPAHKDYLVGVSSFFWASLPVAMPGGVLGAPGVPGAVEAPGVVVSDGTAGGPIGADPDPWFWLGRVAPGVWAPG